jgi:hypothetical protein
MNHSFGPWSTAINTGTRQDLNTFWKRRLAMLPNLSQSAGRITRRAVVVLGLLAIGGLALPTLRRGTQAQSIVQVIEGDALAGQAPEAGKPGSAGEPAEPSADVLKFKNARPTVEFLPRLSPEERRIVATLDTPVTVEFLDLPLEDAITFLREYVNLSIILDKGPLTEEGVAIDAPVTLKLEKIRLESILKLLLRPLQLDFVVEDDILKITTRAAERQKMITRTYPVRDLYQGRDQIDAGDATKAATGKGNVRVKGKYTDLEEAITRNIDPDSWESQEHGSGSLTYVKETGSLVIRQSWSVHRSILQLLRDLREAKRLGAAEPRRTNVGDKPTAGPVDESEAVAPAKKQ